MSNNFERIGHVILLIGCIIFTIWLFWHGTAVEAMTMFAATGILFWLYVEDFYSDSGSAPTPRKGVTGLSVKPESITLTYATGQSETLPLSQLSAVKIVTNSSGPFADDLFFILIGDWGTRRISGDLDDCQQLFGLFDRLPNFDHEKSVQAMCSTANAVFDVWHAPQGTV